MNRTLYPMSILAASCSYGDPSAVATSWPGWADHVPKRCSTLATIHLLSTYGPRNRSEQFWKLSTSPTPGGLGYSVHRLRDFWGTSSSPTRNGRWIAKRTPPETRDHRARLEAKLPIYPVAS